MTTVTMEAMGRGDTVWAEGQISGAVLRVFRRHLGLPQEQLAEILGVTTAAYRCWERGSRPLTRVPVFRLRGLLRALVELGIPAAMVDALEVAIDLDIDVTRALASEENSLRPSERGEAWQSLLVWALAGTPPAVFSDCWDVEPPRLCARDRSILSVRAGWELGG